MALTERQQQIKDLIEQGKNAEAVGKQLGISTNAVYQQLRRMRKGTSAAKPGRKSGAKTGVKRGSSPKVAVAPRPAPAPQVVTLTPLQSVRARRDEIKAKVGALNGEVETARKALAAAEAVAAKAADRHKDELKALDRAEAALRPSTRTGTATNPPKAARKRPARSRAAKASTNGSQAAQGATEDAASEKVAAAA